MSSSRPRAQRQVGEIRLDESTRLTDPTAARAREDVATVLQRAFFFGPRLDPYLVCAGKPQDEELWVEVPSLPLYQRLSTEAIPTAMQPENTKRSNGGSTVSVLSIPPGRVQRERGACTARLARG
jgi:hypothetical protein